MSDDLSALLGEEVVLDVASPYVFIGRLCQVTAETLVLDDADAHDLRDSHKTREKYVLDVRRFGAHPSRGRVWVSRREVVAVSRLADVRLE